MSISTNVPIVLPKPPVFFAERLSALLKANPDLYDLAVELRIVDQDWLENPREIDPALSTVETLRRFAERAAERSPSSMRALRLNALQLLSWDLAWKRVAGRGTPEADVSVLFIDLQGFTQFTSVNGDSTALALLDEHSRTVGPIVRRFDGRIVKRIGDGMMIVFEDPVKVIRGGAELVAAKHPLPLRAGAHSGRAVVSDFDVFGQCCQHCVPDRRSGPWRSISDLRGAARTGR